ncbi:MAG: hypothetical protein PHR25_06290 [Clostridia bacterium]|nr:hypothetical protein [Clostridia bacterium]
MGIIKIKSINSENNIVKVNYEVTGDIKKFFNDSVFFNEYYSDISGVPEEILVIPFVANVLPIIWLTDSTLVIEKIDKTFYNSIDEFKKGFINMYPDAKFKGNIEINELIDCKIDKTKEVKHSIFFTGGVDSTSSLISVIETKPILITLWGSDIWLHDEEGWNKAKDTVDDAAKYFGLETAYIKSNFRKFINEQELSKHIKETIKDSWWHGIQHGIGLLGHVAPYAYKMNIKTHYIPSTYTAKDRGITCASYPTIDENFKFCNCNVIHEGFDKDRQQKVHNICTSFKGVPEKLKLRVCYMERGNKSNCCKCEKCYRTIMSIISEKEDPIDYGFEISKEELANIPNIIKRDKIIPEYVSETIWKPIQQNFLKDEKYWKKHNEIKWILKFNFNNKQNSNIFDKIKNRIKNIKLF